ncbi:hypothetical protein KFE94_16015 [bacterium SCSIO 12643]|nr:hypothetical protein KFE94_16015 [bacterium SCSIO 12643]
MKNQFWRGERNAGKKLIQSELKEMYKGINQLIDEILWNDWDPIGVNDIAPRDEYQDYVPEICSLIIQNKSVSDIADKLHQIETEVIGVVGNRENCLNVANKIMSEINKDTHDINVDKS